MTRAELAVWLGERYGAYLGAVSRDATDTPGNLKAPIDDALRALGVPDADLSAATATTGVETVDWRLQASYRLMAQVSRDLATSFDITTSGDSLRLSQMRAAAERDLAAAATQVVERFGTLGAVETGDGLFGPDLVIDGNFLMDSPVVRW